MADTAHSTEPPPPEAFTRLTGSSPPGGASPAFEPVAAAAEAEDEHQFQSVHWPNPLNRTAEQHLLDLNAEYERAIAFYEAASDLSLEVVDMKCDIAIRVLREIEIRAFAVPAHSLRAVALKARILSWSKAEWWEYSIKTDDADARVLIDDLLGLAGLGPIRHKDFAFANVIPGYRGPGRVPDLAPPATVADAYAGPETTLERLGREVDRLHHLHESFDIEVVGSTDNIAYEQRLRRRMTAIGDRIAAIELQASYEPSVNLVGAMVQVMVANSVAEEIFRNLTADMTDEPKEREFERLMYSIKEALARAAGVDAQDYGGAYFMPARANRSTMQPEIVPDEPVADRSAA